jgi:hypothetical protein
MDDKRKIIINEIEQWRRSRLLPEHYCDFLMNLYLDDPNEKPSSGLFGVSANAIRNSNWKIWMIIFGVMAAVAFTALNFNSFEFPMQIGVSISFLVLTYGVGGLKRKDSPIVSHLLFGTASLFLLFMGVYLMKQYGMDSPVSIVAYVVFASMVWILSGMLAQLFIFQLSGWICLAFGYGWLLHYKLDDIQWFSLEISWVPLSFMFGWLGWLVQRKNKQFGTVFLLLSCIVWFMPEFYGLIYQEKFSQEWIQLSLLGKIVCEGIVLFALRKKWIEWVA